jgi:hypothetical protein
MGMASRKAGKKHHDVVLEEIVPARRRRLRVYITLAVALALLGTYVLGLVNGRQHELSLERERDQLAREVAELENKLRTTRDQLALQRTSTRMAEQAQSQVRSEIRTLRDQVAELEEAVAFYKNVMAPGQKETGLSIEQLDLAPAEEARTHDFRLVLTQLGDNRAFLDGQVQIRVTGQRGDNEVTLSNDVLSAGSETRFRFRYFQELTGRVELPKNFDPTDVNVKAVATGRRQARAEREFNWTLEDSDRDWAG